LEETIRREKCLYDQHKGKPTFQKSWEDKKKFKREQRQKGNKPPFFKNSPQGQPVLREPGMAEGYANLESSVVVLLEFPSIVHMHGNTIV
jgi:hypothetical protein